MALLGGYRPRPQRGHAAHDPLAPVVAATCLKVVH